MRQPRIRRIAAVILTISLCVPLSAVVAGEGMWVPHDIERLPVERWRESGLELGAGDIHGGGDALTGAIVKLGGGTGSFVSPRGLMVTNHHVAYGAIQRSSSVEADHLADGFLATALADEIHAPGMTALVLRDVEDVTAAVMADVDDGMSPGDRYDAIDRAQKRIVENAEKDRDVYCEVRSFYGGSEYWLYTYFRVKDVRLVYTPPQAIGEYGGDIDNWMWPRHTGDFAFMRAYVAPDGSSAEYAEDNVPYEPTRYLSVSRAPLSAGDFTMVIGYPGRTARYRSSHSIDFIVNTYYPRRIEYFGDLIDLLDEESARGRDVELKLTGRKRGLANAHKNYLGQLEGLRRGRLIDRKREEEAKLIAYLDSNPELKDEYGGVLDGIRARYDDYREFWEQAALLRTMLYVSPAMSSATSIYKWAVEQEKDDIDRDKGYQARDEDTRRRRLETALRTYESQADRRALQYMLIELGKAGFADKVDGIRAAVSPDEVESYLDDVYARTEVMDHLDDWFGKSRDELLALGDPMIELAANIHEEREAIEKRTEAYEGALQELRPKLMALRSMASGGALYPDANSTMRISVGKVKGYSPADAVRYAPFTYLSGVVAKHTGDRPFDVPEKLIELSEAGDFGPYADPETGDVPVCFLSTDDVTGGNSGSPILNGRGELIGLVFDGNYESISADYQFIPPLTRTINVDSRYMLFVIDRFSEATSLLDELNVVDGGAAGAGRSTGRR